MSMKPQWDGKLEDFPLERYPDYRPGLPPDWRALASKSFLDECAYIWGKRWGSMGIGKLREVESRKRGRKIIYGLTQRGRDVARSLMDNLWRNG